jgi:hypothetical protein
MTAIKAPPYLVGFCFLYLPQKLQLPIYKLSVSSPHFFYSVYTILKKVSDYVHFRTLKTHH